LAISAGLRLLLLLAWAPAPLVQLYIVVAGCRVPGIQRLHTRPLYQVSTRNYACMQEKQYF